MATTEQSAGTPSYNGLDWAARPASEGDLARGMLLLRASNMNVMRLQLAMERSDKRLAMEALDGLVALDGEIKGFMEDMPPTDGALDEMSRRLDAQKAVLASEKLVFAAGRAGPSLARRNEIAPSPPVAEPEVARSLNLPPSGTEPQQAEPEWIPAYLLEEEEKATGRGRRFALIAAVMLLLILAGAAALYMAGLSALPLGALPFMGGE